MAELAPDRFEHVLYGSPTGQGGYEILGHSPGVTPVEQEAVARFSNIGGSILLEEAPDDIYAFYELGSGTRWAFTRIFFRDRGPRGNDYRALTLILTEKILDKLRWDPFLIEGGFRAAIRDYEAGRPAARSPNLTNLEKASRHRLVLRPGIDPDQLATVLRSLAGGAVVVSIEGNREGAAVCRSVLSALPPDDRRSMSFCTRYSYRRTLPFRLTFYAPQDEEQIGRYLDFAGSTSRGHWGSLPVQQDYFRNWCEILIKELDPLSGLLLLEDPLKAYRLSHFFLKWVEEGSEPSGMSTEVQKQIYDLILDDCNQNFESVQQLRVYTAWKELRLRLGGALSAGSSFSAELGAISSWIIDVTSEDPPIVVFRNFLLGRSTSHKADFLDRTACALLLVVGTEARPDLLYGSPESAFREAGDFARWVEELAAVHSQACLDLLTIWFRRGRAVNWAGCVAAAQAIARAMASRALEIPSAQGAPLFLSAFEQAAPESPEERASWIFDLLRRVGSEARSVFSPLRAARIAAQESLIGQLTDDELADLAEPLMDHFPGPLLQQLDWDRIQAGRGLLSLLACCESGLLLRDGACRDVADSPDRWGSASRVALRSAQAVGTAEEPAFWNRLGWLLWHVSHLDPGLCLSGGEQADARFTEALLAGFQQCPPGMMHVLVDTAFVRRKAGRRADLELRCPNPEAVWLQTLRDIRDSCPTGTRFYSMVVLSHLEQDGFFSG